MQDETWLITGAQGFVGRYLAECIARESPRSVVAGVGRSPRCEAHFSHQIATPSGSMLAPLPAQLQSSAAKLRYHSLDVTDFPELECLLRTLRPKRIVHLASGLRGDRRADLLHINVEGTATLFEAIACIDGYAPRVVVGSSGGVYGQTCATRLPLREGDSCEPVDEYGVTKLAAELLARGYAARSGISLAIARIFNVLGPGQDERHVAGRIALELMKARAEFTASIELGTLSTTRDFVDVRDTARALFTLATNPDAEGLFNVASGEERAVLRLWEEFLRVSGISASLRRNEQRDPGVSRHYGDIGRLLATGYRPAYSLEQSVSHVWNYYRQIWLN